jgi:hypothetical protein
MGKSPDAPAPRDLAGEIQQILSQGPALLASDATLGPQYTGLDLRNLQLALEGAPEGTQTIHEPTSTNAWRNTRTGEISYQDPFQALEQDDWRSGRRWSPGGRNSQSNEWQPYVVQGTTTREVSTPATPGLLDIYRDTLIPGMTDINTTTRTAAYNDLRTLNPEQAGLMDQLNEEARLGLEAGSRLSPEETYRVVNPVRSDWASRGLGASAPAQLDEALQLFVSGDQLLDRRMDRATQTATLNNALYTQPAFAAGSVDMNSLLGMGSQYGQQPNILQQLGGYGSDVFNSNFNADAAHGINSANAANAQTATYAQLAASIAMAAALCWAAREVFGASDPRWLRFRNWMLYHAPEKFREWYLLNGPRWARRLKGNPLAKDVVKRWMLKRIATVEEIYAV